MATAVADDALVSTLNGAEANERIEALYGERARSAPCGDEKNYLLSPAEGERARARGLRRAFTIPTNSSRRLQRRGASRHELL